MQVLKVLFLLIVLVAVIEAQKVKNLDFSNPIPQVGSNASSEIKSIIWIQLNRVSFESFGSFLFRTRFVSHCDYLNV